MKAATLRIAAQTTTSISRPSLDGEKVIPPLAYQKCSFLGTGVNTYA
jgi:hypothetical protein